MNECLYERSHFISGEKGDRAYEKYLDKIREGKNYKFYKEIADYLWECGVSAISGDIRRILTRIDEEFNNRYAYHYEWYSSDAKRALELVIMETEARV